MNIVLFNQKKRKKKLLILWCILILTITYWLIFHMSIEHWGILFLVKHFSCCSFDYFGKKEHFGFTLQPFLKRKPKIESKLLCDWHLFPMPLSKHNYINYYLLAYILYFNTVMNLWICHFERPNISMSRADATYQFTTLFSKFAKTQRIFFRRKIYYDF